MSINENNRHLIQKHILKHRPDLELVDLEELPDWMLVQENKNISRYETGFITGYCIGKNENIDTYIEQKKRPFIISFRDYKKWSDRRITYMEYIKCIDANIIKDYMEFIPLFK